MLLKLLTIAGLVWVALWAAGLAQQKLGVRALPAELMMGGAS